MSRRFAAHDPFEVEDGELNLTPYLDIITTLVIFMIFTFQVVIEFRIIDSIAPQAVAGDGGGGGSAKVEASVLVTKDSIIAIAAGGEISVLEQVPRVGGKFDYAKLRSLLSGWKTQFNIEDSLVLSADRDVEYTTIIETMDAVRRDGNKWLFPDVVLGEALEPGQAIPAPGGATP